MKSFNRTWNTPSRVLTPLVAQGMSLQALAGVKSLSGALHRRDRSSGRPRPFVAVDRRLWYALHALGFESRRLIDHPHPSQRIEAIRRARPLGGRARGRRAHPDAGTRRGDRRHRPKIVAKAVEFLARFSFAPCARTLWPMSAPALPSQDEVTRC